MNPEWIQVRLRRETADLLRAYARRQFRLTTLHDAGASSPDDGQALSLDAAVKVLLFKARQDEERQARHAKNRKREEALLTPPEDLE